MTLVAQEIELLDPSIYNHTLLQSDRFYQHLYTGMEDEGNRIYASWFHYCVEEQADGSFVKKIFHPENNDQIDLVTFEDKSLKVKSGLSVHWFDNGHKVCHGQYKDNAKEGEWKYFYYENDSLFAQGNYRKSERDGLWKFWHLSGELQSEMRYQDGILHGDFKWFDEEGTLNYRGNYEDGFLTFDEKLIDDKWVTNYEGQFSDAYLVGCEGISNDERKTCTDKKIMDYLYDNIEYPSLAKQQAVEGLAVFRIVLDSRANIVKVIPMRGLSNSITIECMRLLMNLPDMSPATLEGKPVETSFVIPMRFRIVE